MKSIFYFNSEDKNKIDFWHFSLLEKYMEQNRLNLLSSVSITWIILTIIAPLLLFTTLLADLVKTLEP